MDWFLPWPRDALLSVAHKYVSEFKIITNQVLHLLFYNINYYTKIIIFQSIKNTLDQMMAKTHDTIEAVAQQYFHKFRRHIYITPKSYLSFIHRYLF